MDSTQCANNTNEQIDLPALLREINEKLDRLLEQTDTGYWICKTHKGEKPHQYYCVKCNGKESSPRRFCPRCGLDMRRSDNNGARVHCVERTD